MSPIPPARPHLWPTVGLIRAYRYSLSGLMGRQCRHWPSCSEYAEEAIRRHGFWAGGWMGLARICRCGPGGTSGIDLVCEELPEGASWMTPWRYSRWRGVNGPPGDESRSATPSAAGPEATSARASKTQAPDRQFSSGTG
ncbi:MAG: membrane protein insertion efficiency factor YidD [Beijerinckiaceae bacterium]